MNKIHGRTIPTSIRNDNVTRQNDRAPMQMTGTCVLFPHNALQHLAGGTCILGEVYFNEEQVDSMIQTVAES